MKYLIISINEKGRSIAALLKDELGNAMIANLSVFKSLDVKEFDGLIFIGALGICVREIAPILKNKYVDPAVVCVDTCGKYAISVSSGHIGGANLLAERIARIIGAEPVITTQSDNSGIWALDTLATKFGWSHELCGCTMNQAIFALVNGEHVALLMEIKDKGTMELERTLPSNVHIYSCFADIPKETKLVIAVTPYLLESDIPVLYYRPKVLCLGYGCNRDCATSDIAGQISEMMRKMNLSSRSIASVATIELKRQEPSLMNVAQSFNAAVEIYQSEDLQEIEVPNPSEIVHDTVGLWGVAESCAVKAAGFGPLLIEKQKCEGFTFAVAMMSNASREGHIEIVGAGPGDPELVSVRGKHFLETADLILYAGSLVPQELTHYAKQGCVVRSSASMNLEEQFELMKQFYDRGLLVVRLHTGDPCIYGAIQEQMAFFDKHGMSYHITPGISSFQAAAAELKSQFTIPEEVQTIILTRGEGNTPMPEREQLHNLAKSQSTMCIYLSAAIVEKVQEELLQAYPPQTPVAACYKLTWKEQRIYRGQLKDLAKIVRENNLTLTTLLVVGKAIDNRQGLSCLYDRNFHHLFRP